MSQDLWAFQIDFNFMRLDVFKLSVPAPLSSLFDILVWSIIVMRNLVESLLIIISGNP